MPPSPTPDFVLRDVHVRFRRHRIRSQSLQRTLAGLLGRRTHETTDALRGVDLEIRPGERVGLIGRNGAGKSTLMRVLARVAHPTRGTVLVNRARTLAPLLELGIGFMPDLSGRENCLLAGALMGLSRRQVEERMDSIIAFSELDGFMDEPVKTYSSGMYARLAFALATDIRPDILLLDEVFGVGDEFFMAKCLTRIHALIESGCTTVTVSHNGDFLVQRCDRIVWLDHGRVVDDGPPARLLQAYRDRFADGSLSASA